MWGGCVARQVHVRKQHCLLAYVNWSSCSDNQKPNQKNQKGTISKQGQACCARNAEVITKKSNTFSKKVTKITHQFKLVELQVPAQPLLEGGCLALGLLVIFVFLVCFVFGVLAGRRRKAREGGRHVGNVVTGRVKGKTVFVDGAPAAAAAAKHAPTNTHYPAPQLPPAILSLSLTPQHYYTLHHKTLHHTITHMWCVAGGSACRASAVQSVPLDARPYDTHTHTSLSPVHMHLLGSGFGRAW